MVVGVNQEDCVDSFISDAIVYGLCGLPCQGVSPQVGSLASRWLVAVSSTPGLLPDACRSRWQEAALMLLWNKSSVTGPFL